MKTKLCCVVIALVFGSALAARSQTPTPDPDAEAKIAKMQAQIDILKQQKALDQANAELAKQRIDELKSAIGANTNSKLERTTGSTTYENKEYNAESIELSYEALKEIGGKVNDDLKGSMSQYSGLVLYHDLDFKTLAQFRMQRKQIRIALENYNRVMETLRNLEDDPGGTGAKSVGPLMDTLAFPAMGTAMATSVADLLSVFRTDTTITESFVKIDDVSLGAVVAREVKRSNPNIAVYFPQAFVAEYDLEEQRDGSLISDVGKIGKATIDLAGEIAKIKEVPENLKKDNTKAWKDAEAKADLVKKQLEAAIPVSSKSGPSDPGADAPPATDFRQLLRAEKLDQFLAGGTTSGPGAVNTSARSSSKIGVLKLRVLSSGGSRRERRNMIFGNKTDFSGSVVVEVILFDATGALQSSNIYSLHTGFRKLDSAAVAK